MRIVYSVHGYGRGHATRALAVLPALTQRHKVLVLAGADAYLTLREKYEVVRIPRFRFFYGKSGRLSNWLNFKRNISGILDLFLDGPGMEMVADVIRQFEPEVVISDSEAFTHHAARRMKIPRISFDHYGLLAYCQPQVSLFDKLRQRGGAFVYGLLCRKPERCVVTSFFSAPIRKSGIRLVGPVIRTEVFSVQSREGEHLLAYVSEGHGEYTPAVEAALRDCGHPVIVYGTSRRGMEGDLTFKPFSNVTFIEDLASCKAVFATTGNQLIGEVIQFQKPMLGVPIHCLEQRLNAAQLDRMGIGKQIRRSELTADLLRNFMAGTNRYQENYRRLAIKEGREEAVAAIEDFIQELVNPRPPAQPEQLPLATASTRHKLWS